MDDRSALSGEDGRVWLIADGVTRAGAEAIARRLEGAVRALGSWRGAPLSAAVGVALHPHDGQDAAALAARAEEGGFAAAAAGVVEGHDEVALSRRPVIDTRFDINVQGAAFYEDRYRKVDGEWKIKSTGYKRTYEMSMSTADLASYKVKRGTAYDHAG